MLPIESDVGDTEWKAVGVLGVPVRIPVRRNCGCPGTHCTSYGYPSTSHRLTSVGSTTRSYDATGSLTDRGDGVTFEYDDRQRLEAVRLSGVLQQINGYSARGERVVKSDGAGLGLGTSTYFTYDESGKLLAEYRGVGSATPVLQKEYLWVDDRPVAVYAHSGGYAGTTLFVHSDHLGTPRALRRPKLTQATAWRWDLEGAVFGDHAPLQDPDGDGTSIVFNLRYPGQYFDTETGLHYNYFRDYEAGTGRYVESDPIGLIGGVTTYAYVSSSPIGAVDPQGLFQPGMFNGALPGARYCQFVSGRYCCTGIGGSNCVDPPAGGGANASVGLTGVCFLGGVGGSYEVGFSFDTESRFCLYKKSCVLIGVGAHASASIGASGAGGTSSSGSSISGGYVGAGGAAMSLLGGIEVDPATGNVAKAGFGGGFGVGGYEAGAVCVQQNYCD